MLKTPSPYQHQLEMVSIETLVPDGHLVRLVDATIDFSFIHNEVAPLYCANNGVPPKTRYSFLKSSFWAICLGSRVSVS